MANQFGGLTVADSLQALRVANGTVVQYGENDVWNIVNAAFTAANVQMTEQLSQFCDVTSQRLRRYGNPQGKSMEELDESGRPQGAKGRGGSDVGFPLRKYGSGLSWNKDYFLMTTTRDFAAEITQIMTADTRRIIREIKRALYLPTNYSFTDRLIDFATLPVKRLANADGQTLPLGPNGQTFDASSHTHYLAKAASSLAATDVSALIAHVTEHFDGGKVILVINQAQETAVRGFTSNFVPYLYEGLTASVNTLRADGKTITPFQTFNRAIGLYDGAEVWVKPWAIAGYMVCMIQPTEGEKCLSIRVRGIVGQDGSIGAALPSIISGGSAQAAGFGDLRLVAQYDDFPLRAQSYEREFGMGVQNRVAAAILYTGGTSYVAPTVTDLT